jgi:hypothetical protein
MLTLYCSPKVILKSGTGSPPLIVTDFSVVWSRPCHCRKMLPLPGADLLDVGQGRLRGMRHRPCNELRKIGVGDERTGRVENHDDTVLPAAVPDEIAESIELEIGGKDARYLARVR